MKTVIVLGANGMAGNTITRYLQKYTDYKIYTVARNNAYYNIDIENQLNILEEIILDIKPDIIINCIGLLIQDCNKNPKRAIYLNSYFPYWLSQFETKIIHLSTNCVFQEDRGNYTDIEIPDGCSWYARTKAMGELWNNKDLTIRLSIIGKELKDNGSGLFSWFMRQEGEIQGYTKVYWNGITCLCLAQNIVKMIEKDITGLYQLAPKYIIDKYSLLEVIKFVYNKQDIKIIPDNSIIKNSTLINSYRENFTPYFPKGYYEMLMQMKQFDEEK